MNRRQGATWLLAGLLASLARIVAATIKFLHSPARPAALRFLEGSVSSLCYSATTKQERSPPSRTSSGVLITSAMSMSIAYDSSCLACLRGNVLSRK